MEKLTLIIKGEPVPKQGDRTRISWPKGINYLSGKEIQKKAFVQHYTAKEVTDAEKAIAMQVKSQLPPFWQPWDGPIMVEKIIYAFKPIGSLKASEKEMIKAGEMVPKSTKPDVTDNIPKLIFDAMEKIVYTNDSRIFATGHCLKCYWKNPGTYIKLICFENNEEYYEYLKSN